MKIGKLFQISLATKCQILFGIAVVTIITTALLVPWLYMGILVGELNVSLAKQAALTVQSRYALGTQDWDLVQEDLNTAWPDLARHLHLHTDVPRLVYLGGCPEEIPEYFRSFEADAIKQLCENTDKSDAFRIESIAGYGRLTRYALAIWDRPAEDSERNLIGLVEVPLSAQELWSYTNLYQLVLIGAAFVAGLLAIVVFYLITQSLILSPVRDLKDVAKRIVTGETELRSEIETGDEFEELGEAFNEMLAHLNASQEELRKMNKSLDVKLGELAETNVALFEANRLKSEFLANVSHELRTPLTSIIGFAELLRDAAAVPAQINPDKIKRFCNNILTSGRMLLDLINNLLDLAKIEAGKMKLHCTTFPLADICEAVIDFTKPLADKKALQVNLRMPQDAPTMNSDAGKIQQIFYNLLSNAIKFTPPGGRIDVQVQRDGQDAIRLRVKDTGPGIPPDLQPHIFEKFRQLDGSVTREYGGSGLGLAISRELATIMGGTLSVESQADRGAEFAAVLPLSCPSEVEVAPIRSN